VKRILFFMSAVLVAALILAACSVASSPASCAFVYGDGQDGRDAKLHNVIYPGQTVSYSTGERISYVPCNSRNYWVNDGTITDANGARAGDRFQLMTATTSTGVPIRIAARALWTLNQDPDAMAAFYEVCHKYNCASTEDLTGEKNYSTLGWNGMLSENFGTAMETTVKLAAFAEGIDDGIWRMQDPAQYKSLADKMSELFPDVVRANLGYPDDLFCGSGNSTWSDPNRPGEGEFTCTPVRFVIDNVLRGEVLATDSTQGVQEINAQRLRNAEALYGEDAGYWLGIQDSIEACRNAGTTCIINIGGAPVAIPVTSTPPQPVPSPIPTEED